MTSKADRIRKAITQKVFSFLFGLTLVIGVHAQQNPNIIVILADDMGYSDLSCYGGEIPTPHLDQLAAGGLRLTQFYNGARCCPTRASLLTGLYAHEAGVGYMVKPVEKNPAYQGRLNDQCVTLAEVLQEAGYFTAMSGKWHLGHRDGHRPEDRGFARSLSGAQGGFYFSGDEKARLSIDGRPVTPQDSLPSEWYSTDLWTRYGLQFIDEARVQQKPFFLYLAHNAPHFPLQAPEEDIARFRGKYKKGWEVLRRQRYERQKALGVIDKSTALPPFNPLVPRWESLTEAEKDRYDHMMAIYAAAVSRLDRSVGELVQGLKQRNLFDNTIIVFLSDNGGNAEPGVEGIYKGEKPGQLNSVVHIGQGWAELNNTPFWLYKHHTSEGGIAAPFILSWPAAIKSPLKGTLSGEVGHIIDIMPTCLEAAGGRYPAAYKGHAITPAEGVSLLPLLRGLKPKRQHPVYWEHEGNRALREGKWKIVSNLGEPWQLYDMEADRTELHNLAATQPALLQQLVGQYEKWYKRVGAAPYFDKPQKWQYSLMKALGQEP